MTTAIGLGSLYASDIVPIRKFGVYSAWGVVAMLAILFLYLPAALDDLARPEEGRAADAQGGREEALGD